MYLRRYYYIRIYPLFLPIFHEKSIKKCTPATGFSSDIFWDKPCIHFYVWDYRYFKNNCCISPFPT